MFKKIESIISKQNLDRVRKPDNDVARLISHSKS